MMSNKTYDILKWVALTVLNALGLLYSTLAEIWSLPYGDAVMKTCAAFAFCLGTLLGISSKMYKDENTFLVDFDDEDGEIDG